MSASQCRCLAGRYRHPDIPKETVLTLCPCQVLRVRSTPQPPNPQHLSITPSYAGWRCAPPWGPAGSWTFQTELLWDPRDSKAQGCCGPRSLQGNQGEGLVSPKAAPLSTWPASRQDFPPTSDSVAPGCLGTLDFLICKIGLLTHDLIFSRTCSEEQ